MKKVGILTYHSSDNYGSVLQAYALRKYLSGFCDAEVINYRKPEVKALYRIFKPMNSKFNIITNFYNVLYYRWLQKKKKAYETFRQKFLNLSEKEIDSKKELDVFVDKYDALICGSDQVWNFDILDFDNSYLLDFRDFNGKKIAYAASMGPKKKSRERVEEFKALFEDFDGISVREETAAEVVSEVLGTTIKNVVDPVLLLSKEDWIDLIKEGEIKERNDDYVFCYFPGGVSKSLEEFSCNLAKEMNCKRILVVPEWRNLFRTGEKMYDCTPIEFVSMIKNAKAVCTDSFHGTAFSVIMDTPLYVQMGGENGDARILNILKMANRESCIINRSENDGETPSRESLEKEIDYSKGFLSEMFK